MSKVREITPHVVVESIVCGEIREGRSYTNWRPRGSGDWLLIFTLDGAGSIVTDNRAWQLGVGESVLFRPDAAQDYSTDPSVGQWSLRWAHFKPRPHWMPWLAWPEAGLGVGHARLGAEAAERFGAALHRMLLAARLGGTHATELALNALEEALIWAQRGLAGDRSLGFDPRIRKAIAYLADDPARPFSIDELASHCGLSSSRLSHLFKTQVKLTPRQFSENLRMDLAAKLLSHTGLTVAEVAFKAGFTDPLYFSRRFVRTFGRTPMATRKGGPR
ncbi:MAG TPA: helix-turn-helix domain-containing protein [Opitutaceae bacterium]|nr:helix-turn-helix domain-containing protein [Opitutaceae bacterium]